MTELQKRLFALRDEKYATFQGRLIPTLSPDCIIGIRMPVLRAFAKEYGRDASSGDFLHVLPHFYYDENMLHALLLAEIREYDRCMAETELFLPYIDNWAVCDCLAPKAFSKKLPELFRKAEEWSGSTQPYVCRFGIGTLMRNFLDEHFAPEYLRIPASVHSDEYYVKMMVAWFFATALAKQWESSVPYLEEQMLDVWTHNKTIQKACESYRIPEEGKRYLRTLKR